MEETTERIYNMKNEIFDVRKKIVIWNIVYVILNAIPILGLIGFIVFIPNIESFSRNNSIDASVAVFGIILAMLLGPFAFTGIVQYKKNMHKIKYNGLISNLFVQYINNSYGINLKSEENSFNNASKIEHLGFANMGKYVAPTGYFTGDYNKLSFEGAYVHTFYKVGEDSLVHKIATVRHSQAKMQHYYYGFFSGILAEIKNINFKYDPIVIYDKKYKKKNFMYQFDNNSRVKTGNKDFDSKYEVMSANPAKAQEYLTNDIIEAILETGKINRPHGFHFIGKSLCIAVQTKDLDFKPSIFKKINVDFELENMKNHIESYNKLLNVL